MLGITEELFLISLREKRDSLKNSSITELPYALAGAILFELILSERIRLEDGKRIVLSHYELTGSEVLNLALDSILELNRPKKITYWINELSMKDRIIRKSLLKSLVHQGVLHKEEKRYFWVIPYTEYSQKDGSAKFLLKNELRRIVLAGEAPNQRTVTLLSLLRAAKMLDHVFTEDEMKAAKERVEEIIEDETIGESVSEVLQSIEAATVAALSVYL